MNQALIPDMKVTHPLARRVGMSRLSPEPWRLDAVDVGVICAQLVPSENVIQSNKSYSGLARGLAHHLVKVQLGVFELRKGLVRVAVKPWAPSIGCVLVAERSRREQERVSYRHHFPRHGPVS